jgi:dihydrofolate synthase/folylpolyglutamate synthase
MLSASLEGQTFELDGSQYHINGIGEKQPEAAVLAAIASRVIGISDFAIRAGLNRAVIPCRTQYIVGSPDLLLDGAHNGPAVAILCRTLDRYFSDRKKVLLFACMKDKDYADMADQLALRFEQVVVTNIDSLRGADVAVLSGLFRRNANCIANIEPFSAFANAKEIARKTDSLLVVCGSFYLAGKIHSIQN